MRKIAKPSRTPVPQLNIRSAFAVKRARELAKVAGVTTTKIVEDALRDYKAPSNDEAKTQWQQKLHEIAQIANEGLPPFDWRAVENEMYDEWGNAK